MLPPPKAAIPSASRPQHAVRPAPSDLLTAKLGARPVSLVAGRVAAAGVSTLVTDDVHHLRRTVGPAEARPLPRKAEAGALGAARLLAAPVAHVHLPFPLVGAAKLRLLPLPHARRVTMDFEGEQSMGESAARSKRVL